MQNPLYKVGDTVLEHWELVHLIGEGGFGRVFAARREDFNSTYTAAIKIITIPKSADDVLSARAEGMDDDSITNYFYGLVEDVTKEFALMSSLKGTANIVSYEDHAVIPHKDGIGWDIIIRMELLTPLLKHATTTTPTRQNVIKLGIDMCRALELCHKYNVVHRDIKPENIFISKIGDYKLGDFGIARTIEKTTSNLTKVGTITYMAPEVYRDGSYGSSVDIYSLGIVLYRLLNGNRSPFLPDYPAPISHNDRALALSKRLSGAKMPNPQNANGRLAEIVLKACAYNPAERYSSPLQMRQELEAIQYNDEESAIIYPDGDEAPLESSSDTVSTASVLTEILTPAENPPADIPENITGNAPVKKKRKHHIAILACIAAFIAIGITIAIILNSSDTPNYPHYPANGTLTAYNEPPYPEQPYEEYEQPGLEYAYPETQLIETQDIYMETDLPEPEYIYPEVDLPELELLPATPPPSELTEAETAARVLDILGSPIPVEAGIIVEAINAFNEWVDFFGVANERITTRTQLRNATSDGRIHFAGTPDPHSIWVPITISVLFQQSARAYQFIELVIPPGGTGHGDAVNTWGIWRIDEPAIAASGIEPAVHAPTILTTGFEENAELATQRRHTAVTNADTLVRALNSFNENMFARGMDDYIITTNEQIQNMVQGNTIRLIMPAGGGMAEEHMYVTFNSRIELEIAIASSYFEDMGVGFGRWHVDTT